MKHDEFRIGHVFFCGGKRWRCTDVGTRVIVAISLEPPPEVVTIDSSKDKADAGRDRRRMIDDPSWFNGPPYAIVEHVFDEDSMIACTTEPGCQAPAG